MGDQTKRGGKRPGAGRKPKVKDAATATERESLQELARTHTEAALATLVRVTRSESDSAAVSAANSILDRGYGKAPQGIELTGKDRGPVQIELSPLELARKLAFVFEKAKRLLAES